MKTHNQRGFTLLELLIVVVIICLLVVAAGAIKKHFFSGWHHGQKSHTTSTWTCDDPSGCGSRP